MKSPDKLYKFHVENLHTIEGALERVARSAREAISKVDSDSVFIFLRLYAFLIGAWAECRLRKLLYEQNGFDDTQRTKVQSQSTQYEQWKTSVELAFRRHYRIPRADISKNNLSHSAYYRYITIIEILDQDLRQIIELRNKLAHGQWAYTLNSAGDDVSQDQMKTLRTENILSLQFKKSLISHLSDIVHDLVVSRPTFERDFDAHFAAIEQTRRNLKTREYSVYERQMQAKFQRGKVKASLNRHNP